MEIKTIGQLLEHLAKKAGIDSADPNLINVLSNAELSKVPIHSDIATGIDNALLSLSQATDNHPAIKSKYHAQALNALDARMEALMSESGLDEAVVDSLKGEKNTYKRFEQLFTAIKEAGETKAKSTSKDEKSAVERQRDELLEKLKAAEKTAAEQVAKVQAERKADKVSFELAKLTGSAKTIYDELPADVKEATMQALINKGLQDKTAVFDFDENGAFVLVDKDGNPVLGANHDKINPQAFIDSLLAQNKVLKVTEQSGTTTQQQGNNGQRQTTIDASKAAPKGNNQSIARMNADALDAFNKQVAQA